MGLEKSIILQKFLFQKEKKTSGVGIAATIEGARPLLVEIQSLVSSAVMEHHKDLQQDLIQKE